MDANDRPTPLMKIYLAGYIAGSVIDECTSWRKKIREHYDTWPGGRYPISCMDPLNGERFSEISSDGNKGVIPSHAIVHKDYRCVELADLVIANLNTFGQDRPMIGTFFELAWAYDKRKPIVLITDNESYINHPFLAYAASWIVSDVDTLLERKIINQFYKSFNSAEY